MKEIEEFFIKKLNTRADVNAVWWKYVNNVEAVGAEIKSWDDKKKVMENRSKLRNEDSQIFIENDTTIMERNVRRILAAKAKEKREQNKSVKIGYFWIEIDGKRFTYDERKKTPGLVEVKEEEERTSKNRYGRRKASST